MTSFFLPHTLLKFHLIMSNRLPWRQNIIKVFNFNLPGDCDQCDTREPLPKKQKKKQKRKNNLRCFSISDLIKVRLAGMNTQQQQHHMCHKKKYSWKCNKEAACLVCCTWLDEQELGWSSCPVSAWRISMSEAAVSFGRSAPRGFHQHKGQRSQLTQDQQKEPRTRVPAETIPALHLYREAGGDH